MGAEEYHRSLAHVLCQGIALLVTKGVVEAAEHERVSVVKADIPIRLLAIWLEDETGMAFFQRSEFTENQGLGFPFTLECKL